MTSSAENNQPLPTTYGATTAPPPTPATNPTDHLSSPDAADALSRFFNHLPPSLSLPPRLSPRSVSPPVVPFSPQDPSFLDTHLSSFSQLGFFQLTNHHIPSHLAQSAETESLSLFNLSKDTKQQLFSKTWPLGYDDDDQDESFCLDSSCSTEETESTQLSISSLRELTRELQKIGLEIVEALACTLGFDKALKDNATGFNPMMWVSKGSAGDKQSGRFYPYIVSLQYQIRCTKYSVLTDSGWSTVSPQTESLLVTIGDIAQVWSNGKLKKVRGRPSAISGNSCDNSHCVTMSLLVTLPVDNVVTISPFLPVTSHHAHDNNDEENCEEEKLVYNTFSFEDYAWRVYHERFLFKDPLERYRIK